MSKTSPDMRCNVCDASSVPGIISSVTIGLGEDSYSKPVPLRPGMTPTQVFAKVESRVPPTSRSPQRDSLVDQKSCYQTL